MADKYDKLLDLVVENAEHGDRDDIRSIGEIVADLLRGFEQMGADLDRIATALEKRND